MTQSHSNKRDLTQGEILPHVFRMAIPMTIGIGAIVSFSLADTYFIGLLGAKELAAIGYTFPVTTMFFNLIFGMAIAMSAIVSRKIGAKAIDQVRATTTLGLLIVVIFSTFLSLMGFIFMDKIFSGLGAGPEMMEIIRPYMEIWLVGAIFLSIPVVANSAIRGMGDAFWPAVVMVTIAIVNIILDPILIFGLLGAPAMGVKGAAFASLIAYLIATIAVMMIIIIREKLIMVRGVLKFENWGLIVKPLLMIAIPVSLANVITPIVSYGYTGILSSIGYYAVAGYGVASRFEAFALIPMMALAGGIAPLIGQNYGAKLYDRVNNAINKALKFAIYYAIGTAFVFIVLANPMASVFSDDIAVHQFTTNYLIYVPISMLGLNLFLVVTSAMNAMGRQKNALMLNIFKSFICALPLAWMLSNLYGGAGFFASIIITNFIGGLISLYYLKTIRCKV